MPVEEWTPTRQAAQVYLMVRGMGDFKAVRFRPLQQHLRVVGRAESWNEVAGIFGPPPRIRNRPWIFWHQFAVDPEYFLSIHARSDRQGLWQSPDCLPLHRKHAWPLTKPRDEHFVRGVHTTECDVVR